MTSSLIKYDVDYISEWYLNYKSGEIKIYCFQLEMRDKFNKFIERKCEKVINCLRGEEKESY